MNGLTLYTIKIKIRTCVYDRYVNVENYVILYKFSDKFYASFNVKRLFFLNISKTVTLITFLLFPMNYLTLKTLKRSSYIKL